MPANVHPDARPRLGFNAARFDEVWKIVHGEMTDRQIASELGIHHTVFSEIRRGRRRATPEQIASIRAKLPNVSLDELFPLEGGDVA